MTSFFCRVFTICRKKTKWDAFLKTFLEKFVQKKETSFGLFCILFIYFLYYISISETIRKPNCLIVFSSPAHSIWIMPPRSIHFRSINTPEGPYLFLFFFLHILRCWYLRFHQSHHNQNHHIHHHPEPEYNYFQALFPGQ